MATITEARRWTLEEMHALPEDGNKYELVYGELFVTPAPTDGHETISARLTRILDPYVEANGLGFVYRPRAVFRVGREVEVEPDIMVRQPTSDPAGAWENAPLPSLIVEILSKSTGKRDAGVKRALYMEAGIPEYWIVDGTARTITVIVRDRAPLVVNDQLTWAPAGTSQPLVFAVGKAFGVGAA